MNLRRAGFQAHSSPGRLGSSIRPSPIGGSSGNDGNRSRPPLASRLRSNGWRRRSTRRRRPRRWPGRCLSCGCLPGRRLNWSMRLKPLSPPLWCAPRRSARARRTRPGRHRRAAWDRPKIPAAHLPQTRRGKGGELRPHLRVLRLLPHFNFLRLADRVRPPRSGTAPLRTCPGPPVVPARAGPGRPSPRFGLDGLDPAVFAEEPLGPLSGVCAD